MNGWDLWNCLILEHVGIIIEQSYGDKTSYKNFYYYTKCKLAAKQLILLCIHYVISIKY